MIEFIMKTETEKLIERKKYLETELAAINRELSARTYGVNCITVAMLEKFPFNSSLTGRQLRELSRDWRRFLELPEHVQIADMARCNISISKAGTNGKRFIRREF